jgi:hypothetical protein
MTCFGAFIAAWVLSLDGTAYDPRHDRLFVTGKALAKCIRAEGYSTHSSNVALPVKAFSDY